MDLALQVLEKAIADLESCLIMRKRIESGDISHLVRELHLLKSQKERLQESCICAIEKTEKTLKKVSALLNEKD